MAKVKQSRLDSSIQPALKGRENTRSKPMRSGRSQQGKLVKVNPPCDKDGLLLVTEKRKVSFQGKVYWVDSRIPG